MIKLKSLIKEAQQIRSDGMFRTDPDTPEEVIEMIRNVISVAQQENRNPEGLEILSPDETFKKSELLGSEAANFMKSRMGDVWAISNKITKDELAFASKLAPKKWCYVSPSRGLFRPLIAKPIMDLAIKALINGLPRV